LHRRAEVCRNLGHHGLRLLGDLLQGFFAIEVLAAGEKPDFKIVWVLGHVKSF